MEKKKKNLGEFIKSYKKDYRVRLKVKLILFILFMGPLMIFLLYANSKTENGLMGSIEKETITTTTEKIKKTYKQVLDTYKETYNKTTLKKTYSSLASKLEDMNLKHEFSKIMRCLPHQDIYCGLVVENTTDLK